MLLHLPKAFMCESLMPACLADMAASIMKLWVLKLWGCILRFMKYCIECFPERCSGQGPIGR